jgi:hypothetical protein
MHEMFTPLIRKDLMGIDYGQVTFRYHGKAPDN